MRDMREKKLNNKGMTLVECITSIAILSVAIVPLMSTFVYSATYSGRAKNKQKATNVAQEIIETYKADDLSNIAKCVTTDKPNDLLLNNAESDCYVTAATDGTGVYWISNVRGDSTTDSYEEYAYDAVITVTEGKNGDSTYTASPVFEGPESTLAIVEDESHIADVNKAIYDYFQDNNMGESKMVDGESHHVAVKTLKVERVIRIYIESNGDNNLKSVKVEYIFKPSFNFVRIKDSDGSKPNGDYGIPGSDKGFNIAPITFTKTYDATNVDNIENFNSVTLFYFPYYYDFYEINLPCVWDASTQFYKMGSLKPIDEGMNPGDVIVIHDPTEKMQINLYKQMVTGVDTPAAISKYSLAETNYEIWLAGHNVPGGTGKPYVNTNIAVNLYNEATTGSHYAAGGGMDFILDTIEDSNLLYTIKVDVYKHGDLGTLTDKFDYSAVPAATKDKMVTSVEATVVNKH